MWQKMTADKLRSQCTAHTHTRLTAPCPGLPGWAGKRKVKPIWILLKQDTVSGNGSRQVTTPAPHHSVFYRPDALPAAQQTASKHWRVLYKQKQIKVDSKWVLVWESVCADTYTQMYGHQKKVNRKPKLQYLLNKTEKMVQTSDELTNLHKKPL